MRERLIAPRRRDLAAMVHRVASTAARSGPGVDPDVLVDMLIGPLYHRVLVTGDPIDREVTDEIVDVVLSGAAR